MEKQIWISILGQNRSNHRIKRNGHSLRRLEIVDFIHTEDFQIALADIQQVND